MGTKGTIFTRVSENVKNKIHRFFDGFPTLEGDFTKRQINALIFLQNI